MCVCMCVCTVCTVCMVKGSLEAKLPTISTDEKQSRAEAERERVKDQKREDQKRKSQKKEDGDARKGRKSRDSLVFFQ